MCLLAFAIAVPAFSFVATPRPGDRIGVLRISGQFNSHTERSVAGTIQSGLVSELKGLKFDAFDARLTFDEVSRKMPGDADFYVEVISGGADGHQAGNVGVGISHVAVQVGVVVAQVAAQVRVYDGHTLNELATFDLQKDNTAVVPTGIGITGYQIFAAIALPIFQYGQYKMAAHQVAYEAALRIAGQ
jgi:hypothetical protein